MSVRHSGGVSLAFKYPHFLYFINDSTSEQLI